MHIHQTIGWITLSDSPTKALSIEPSNKINLEALLAGQHDCFIDDTQSPITPQKKTIIFNSFVFSTLPEYIAKQVISFLEQAIKDKFDLYVTTEQGLIKLDSENLSTIQQLSSIPLPLEKVQRLASELNIDSDSCLIYSGRALLALINQLFPAYTPLQYQKIPAYHPVLLEKIAAGLTPHDKLSLENNRIPPQNLLPYIYSLKIQTPAFLEVVMDKQTAQWFEKIESFDASKSSVTMEQVEAVLRQTTYLKTLNLDSCKNFGNSSLNLEGVALDSLESLDVSESSITTEQLQALLKQTLKLKTLSFNCCENLGNSSLNPEEIAFANLESLDISGSSIIAEQLQALLQQTPNIKILSLNSCKNLDYNSLNFKEIALGSLKSLDVSRSSITTEQLQALLKHTPNIKTLRLFSCKNLGNSSLKLEGGTLGSLESLDVSGSSITTEQLQALLKHTPKLKTLRLFSCKNLGNSSLNLEGVALDSLESLDVSGSSITTEQLQALLKHTPNIKTLRLFSCENLDYNSLNLEEIALGSLESLSVSWSSITTEQLQALLKHTPKLKTLNLNSCENLDYNSLNFKEIALDSLESLDVSGSSITTEQLQALLKHTSKLKTLNLNSCEYLDYSSLKLEGVALDSLESLDVSWSSITTEQLQALLKHTPKLKTLTLSSCENLSNSSLKLEGVALGSLESLDVSGSSITTEQLQALLKKTPNIKTLMLFSCENLDYNSLNLEEIALGSLELLDVGESPITIEPLESILQQATNLQTISLYNCSKLNPLDIEALEARYPLVKFYYTKNPSTIIIPSIDPKIKRGNAIDGDVTRSDKQYKIKQIFLGNPPPLVSTYHLNTYAYVNADMDFTPYKPSILKEVSFNACDSANLVLENYNITHAGQFYGEYAFTDIEPNTWYQVPALSADDQLLSAHAKNNYEIQKDSETGYHYIKFDKQSPSCKLTFTIQSKQTRKNSVKIQKKYVAPEFNAQGNLIDNEAFRILNNLPLDEKIQAIQQLCTFNNPFFHKNLSGEPYQIYNQLLQHSVGSCRHRAKTFVALALNLGIEAKLVENNCHAFVVVGNSQNQLKTIDLGGAPASLHFTPLVTRILSRAQDHARETLDLTQNPFATWLAWPVDADSSNTLANQLINTPIPKKNLLVLQEARDILNLHQALFSASPNNILFTHKLDEIASPHTYKIDDKDTPQQVDNQAQIFINKAQNNPNQTYTWYVNWSDIKSHQIKLNTIIDDNPTYHGKPLPPNLQVVNITTQRSMARLGARLYFSYSQCCIY
jgi:hypothetical protein